ncbi:XdhC family protein [Thermoleptolyngbya sichuanensis XZ-Cy5]|uniref:XdhC family protein n=1 Tax=Thermoleptolyngbya sichuanensis TaxID=2885951 RepID=UPI00240D7F4A|nr:XdhC/CoxI family protein [Thermoleptolyngbya sichuanensis]MDG2617568.1 XdhC family protein [Thermoleptolyngbya sichuanensis XZ-Cy5]
MSIQCFSQLAILLQHHPVVLATVIQVRGSVPREVGARMLVWGDGQLWGTIGGGAGEARVIRAAQAVLKSGEKQRVQIDLSGAPNREIQGVCGGWMQVWVERWQGEGAIALAQSICDRLQSGQPATLVTPLAIDPAIDLAPDQSPYLADELGNGQAIALSESAFVETLQPPPALLIVGAGHVGEQLAKVAALIGFQVMVQDDRPEWANADRYPQATRIFTEPIASALRQLAPHPQLYAALVTRGYQYDLEALDCLLSRNLPCFYLGMIGSEKRVRQVYQAIAQRGIDPGKLQTIYAPIGLDIGALTPEEIAVSIAAELILVRRGGTGRSLSASLRQSATPR